VTDLGGAPRGLPARLLLGASAHNDHVQQMARALHECGSLAAYVTGTVDVWRSPMGAAIRAGVGRCVPAIDRQLARRAITQVPAGVVRPRRGWDLLRAAATVAGAGVRTTDWLWERAEMSLDEACARHLERPEVGGYLGIEFGALAALRAARRVHKPGLLAFLSPHHLTRDRWLNPEYDRHPALRSDLDRRIAALTVERDRRRDAEAATADWLLTGSSFTTRSLVAAGVPASRILTVPLGGPDPVEASALPASRPAKTIFVYAGSVAVHKGVHHLLDAWARVAPASAELHVYGQNRLPRGVTDACVGDRGGAAIHFHGLVPAAELRRAYLDGSVLVLPTLADGFGQVVTDALAHGLPVITTTNAGAADCLVHGESGLIVPPADVEALAAALDWCISHPARLFEMRAAALAQAHRWTWRDFRAAFIAAIAGALAQQASLPAERTA
jgi:glycosyltransferase involved in cell wall biosynthesis